MAVVRPRGWEKRETAVQWVERSSHARSKTCRGPLYNNVQKYCTLNLKYCLEDRFHIYVLFYHNKKLCHLYNHVFLFKSS